MPVLAHPRRKSDIIIALSERKDRLTKLRTSFRWQTNAMRQTKSLPPALRKIQKKEVRLVGEKTFGQTSRDPCAGFNSCSKITQPIDIASAVNPISNSLRAPRSAYFALRRSVRWNIHVLYALRKVAAAPPLEHE